MSETIYILLPVHNRREVTRRFIASLLKQSYTDYHLVLIDDGSTDGTADMVREQIQAVTVITGNGSWWWGGALQQGYKWLREQNAPGSDIVLIINDDTEFDSRFLETAVTVLRDRQRTFLLAECYDLSSGALIDAGIHVDWRRFAFEQPAGNRPINCLSTRGLFFRMEDFFSVGGFHPRLLPHYLSDYEFTIRASRKGMTLTTHPDLKIWLDVSTTGSHGIGTRQILGAVKSVFSLKSAINPLMLLIFVALACPWQWKFHAWLRVFLLSLSRAWAVLTERTAARRGNL
jgi:GT2 family glycosyltransferase